jgi:hypothetical protein
MCRLGLFVVFAPYTDLCDQAPSTWKPVHDASERSGTLRGVAALKKAGVACSEACIDRRWLFLAPFDPAGFRQALSLCYTRPERRWRQFGSKATVTEKAEAHGIKVRSCDTTRKLIQRLWGSLTLSPAVSGSDDAVTQRSPAQSSDRAGLLAVWAREPTCCVAAVSRNGLVGHLNEAGAKEVLVEVISVRQRVK